MILESSILAATAGAQIMSMLCSTLHFSLRNFSRTRLEKLLNRKQSTQLLDALVDRADDISYATAVVRLLSNAAVLIGVLALFHDTSHPYWLQYLYAFCTTGLLITIFSLAIPVAIARHAGEAMIALFIRPLLTLPALLRPAIAIMHVVDSAIGRAAGLQTLEQEQQHVEDQILTAVEAGEKEGVVDEQEREMIQSVIEFRDVTAREVMTTRPDIVALDVASSMPAIRQLFETTGHSRIPVYEQNLDHIIGVLYARDLLKYVGESATAFDIRKVLRPAFFIPEISPLRLLLRDFRLQKVHMGIVLDEYGATSGLVTIEDVLEQLVGEISDEHEPQEPAMLRKIDDRTWDVDARIPIADINRSLPITLPEDGEIHTLGGYVATSIGRIPEKGVAITLPGARMIVSEAEPHRITRVRIELTTAPSDPLA